MSPQKTLEYNSLPININDFDFWNATELVTAFNNNSITDTTILYCWLKDTDTKELIELLEDETHRESIIYDENSDVWLHPVLILSLSMYLGAKCYLWCYNNWENMVIVNALIYQ